MTRGSLALFVGVALAVSGPNGTEAQTPSLDRVEELVAEGRFGSARNVLQEWLNGEAETAIRADEQRGTWLRALLTIDPELAELDLRRLIVEYPGGPFSDRALFRLAQGAQARSDEVRTRRYLDALLRDYPESPLRPQARALADRLESAPSDAEEPRPGPNG